MTKIKLFILLSFFVLFGGCAGMHTKPITTQEVVEMAKSGVPSDAIIQKLKDSGTIYQLSASELVQLHRQGVPEPVLDYMQATYLQAIRREEASRAYLYGPPYPI